MRNRIRQIGAHRGDTILKTSCDSSVRVADQMGQRGKVSPRISKGLLNTHFVVVGVVLQHRLITGSVGRKKLL